MLAFAVVQHSRLCVVLSHKEVLRLQTAEVFGGKCYWMHRNDELTRSTKCNHPRFVSFVISELTLLINPLALELDIYSLAHNLCKM